MKFWNKLIHLWRKEVKAEIAPQNTGQEHIDKVIRGLQKQGFLLPLNDPKNYEALLQDLAISAAFTFHIIDREQGALELIVFYQDGKVANHAVDAKAPFDEKAFLAKHAPDAIPLSQLQDVSGWLDNHNWQTKSPLLTLDAIEKKLAKLMRSCPHGAYMLHTQNKSLTLSRLSPGGKIEHMIINLQKRLGYYSLEVDGKAVASTRSEFKKRLQQMGKPIRLVHANDLLG